MVVGKLGRREGKKGVREKGERLIKLQTKGDELIVSVLDIKSSPLRKHKSLEQGSLIFFGVGRGPVNSFESLVRQMGSFSRKCI